MNSFVPHRMRWMAAGVLAFMLAANTAEAQLIRKDALLSALPGRANEPFGLSAAPAPAGPMWIRWREFDTGVAQSADAISRCRAEPSTCSPAQTRLIALIDIARNADGRARFGLVNREVNLSIAYTSDATQHGASDVWSSALASLESRRGDCEDYAIVKYVTLREAGVPAEDLRLLVGRVASLGQAHAVLAARLDGHWLILDNRRMTMIEDERASDLQPLFAFDSIGVKQFAGRENIVAAHQTDVLPASASEAPIRGDAFPLVM
jgi:predicted transglutaminase-like cysteine proteinase